MATLFNTFFRGVDANANVLSAAKLYFYSAGTSTPAKTYSDAGLTVTNANPVVADAGGLFASIYLDTTTQYKVILKDSSDATIQTIDPYTSLTVSAVNTLLTSTAVNALVTTATVSGLLTSAAIGAALGFAPGNPTGSLTTFLTASVALNNTASWFSGPNTSAVGASGQLWHIEGQASVLDAAGAANFQLRIFDAVASAVIATGGASTYAASASDTITMSRVLTLTAATTFEVQAKDITSASGSLLSSNDGGTTNLATSITAIRLK